MVRLNTTVWLAQAADRDLAIRGCTEVIRDNPRASWAYYGRGNAYDAKGEIDRAIADYNKAIESTRTTRPWRNGRAGG
jgi:tetratricopeptide (TPR) repeat protein